MALSGSFSGSIAGGKYKLRVDWSATQSVANNTSKITAVMYLVQANSWSLGISSRDDNETTIAGTTKTWTSPAINNSGGKTTKLGTVTSGNIAHNADGTKSVTISAKFNIKATISGTYYSAITASQTVTLNTIPRATQPTLSASSVNMGSAVTINLPRASSSFTHNLTYDLVTGDLNGSGGVAEVYSGAITTGAGSSYSWTVPDLASYLPDDTQATAVIKCVTKNGSTTVGTKYVYLTVKVPSSVVPPTPSLAIAEATSGLANQFGAYIQNKSKLAVSVAATGVKGSSIVAYQTTVNGKVYTGSSFTTDVITASGTVSLVTKVKDSRGRWSAPKTTTVTVLAYKAPQVTALQAYRVNAAGTGVEDGLYIAVAYKYAVTSLGGKNTAAAVIEYKRSVDEAWETLLELSALSGNATAKPTSPTFSIDYQYDVRLTVTDWFGASRVYTTTLPSGAVILDLLANGKGIAFGKTADQEGLDFGWPVVGRSFAASAGSGVFRLEGGLLIQWGSVTITPSAAGTPTTAIVTFPRPFTVTPTVLATPVSSVPETLSVAVQRAASLVGDNKEAMAVTLTRNGLTATGINWLAIGPG